MLTWKNVEASKASVLYIYIDNMSWCYLVFAYLFPYSCALLLLFIVHVYALE